MNNTRIGFGRLAAALLATVLIACATSTAPNGAGGAKAVEEQKYSHDAYFY